MVCLLSLRWVNLYGSVSISPDPAVDMKINGHKRSVRFLVEYNLHPFWVILMIEQQDLLTN